ERPTVHALGWLTMPNHLFGRRKRSKLHEMKKTKLRLALLLLASGCAGPALIGRAQARNPLFKPPDQVSADIAIPTSARQLIGSAGGGVDPAGAPGYAASGVGFTHPPFYQSAIFQAQSTRHLTFLIELANRWPELTHAENYDVTLVDDKGHV